LPIAFKKVVFSVYYNFSIEGITMLTKKTLVFIAATALFLLALVNNFRGESDCVEVKMVEQDGIEATGAGSVVRVGRDSVGR
jgi:hypothetical protein